MNTQLLRAAQAMTDMKLTEKEDAERGQKRPTTTEQLRGILCLWQWGKGQGKTDPSITKGLLPEGNNSLSQEENELMRHFFCFSVNSE